MAELNDLRFKGLPYKGNQMLFRKKDPPHLQPQRTSESSCVIFELWKTEDLSDFNGLLDEVAKGKKIIWKEDKQWVKEKQNWKVMIIWFSAYYTDPKGYRDKVEMM